MLLGCIADDFTGASDLALTLSREGMRVVQAIGVPSADEMADAECMVVALKSRTAPARRAIELSLATADALIGAGARQIFFKYCSTFDSTDAGNIGPVIEALLQRLNTPLTIVCPAFPANGRTVYQGHLFVHGDLLSDSAMKDHPLTPMRDASLLRVLRRQTQLAVGLLPWATVSRGTEEISRSLDRARSEGQRILVADALDERNLRDLGTAARDMPLVTGASGVALGLPENFRRAGLLAGPVAGDHPALAAGRAAILAGSCSAATRNQVACAMAAGIPSLQLSPSALQAGRQSDAMIASWIAAQDRARPVMIYSTASPAEVSQVQNSLGRDVAASIVEQALARAAVELLAQGVNRLIVAGGETSGAVVEALALRTLRVGPEIDPGVPWLFAIADPPLALALKSGNFGSGDFFLKAWDSLR